jgi:hypothetical protein
VAIGGCLDDGTSLAAYEQWMRANGYLADTSGDSAAAAGSDAVDAAAHDTKPASADTMTAGDGTAAGSCPVVAPGTACSTGGAKAMTLSFSNGCSGNIRIYWVDFNCAESLYHELKPGGSQIQPTYSGHIWRIRAATGELLREYLVPATGMMLNVGVP